MKENNFKRNKKQGFFLNTIILFLLFISLNISGQIPGKSSDLSKIKNDSLRLQFLLDLSIEYRNTNSDSALLFAKQALDIALKRKLKMELADTQSNMGFCLFNESKNAEALEYFYPAIDNYIDLLSKNKKNLVQIAEKLSKTYNTLGEILIYSKNLKKAEEYLNKSLELNSLYGITDFNTNIYINIGLLHYQNENLNKSAKSWNKALKNAKKFGQKELETRLLNNLGSVFFQLKKYTKALEYYKQSYAIQKKDKNELSLISSANNLGLTYRILANYNKAIKYSTEAKRLSAKHKRYYSNIQSLTNLTETYIATEQKDSAHIYFEQTLDAIELYFDRLNANKINELETKYDLDSKNSEIELLKNKEQIAKLEFQNKNERNQMVLMIILALAFFIIAAVLIFFLNDKRKQAEKKYKIERKRFELEQRMLRSQMNPHFIFNALNSIQSFIATNNNMNAEIFLSKFALLIRNILENSSAEFVDFEKELETIEIYIQLEQLRFNNKFEYEIINNLEDNFLKIPPMLIQPIVENSILHGLRNKSEKGMLVIDFKELNDSVIQCSISDNGIGRKAAEELKLKKNNTHNSIATQLTNDRLNYFKDGKAEQSGFKFIDLYDENKNSTGTKVIINLPFRPK